MSMPVAVNSDLKDPLSTLSAVYVDMLSIGSSARCRRGSDKMLRLIYNTKFCIGNFRPKH
jgi:hypothetical protein